jgi:hypothetical protein
MLYSVKLQARNERFLRTANVKNKFTQQNKTVWPCRQKTYFWAFIPIENTRMIYKIACFLVFSIAAGATFAQTGETTRKTGRPDIPGTFVVELGINRGLEAPDDFSIGLWGSRTVNVYYQYDIRILKSRFSLVPGIGVSLERFKFKNFAVMGYDDTDSLTLLSPVDAGYPRLKKSQLITNYVDLPIALKYSTNPEDPNRSFNIAAGGRIGYLYDSFSKLKYREDGEIKQLKDKQAFNLNKIRYGVFLKVGVGNFNVFSYYNLTNLFEDGKGLSEKGIYQDFNTFTVGLSLSSF